MFDIKGKKRKRLPERKRLQILSPSQQTFGQLLPLLHIGGPSPVLTVPPHNWLQTARPKWAAPLLRLWTISMCFRTRGHVVKWAGAVKPETAHASITAGLTSSAQQGTVCTQDSLPESCTKLPPFAKTWPWAFKALKAGCGRGKFACTQEGGLGCLSFGFPTSKPENTLALDPANRGKCCLKCAHQHPQLGTIRKQVRAWTLHTHTYRSHDGSIQITSQGIALGWPTVCRLPSCTSKSRKTGRTHSGTPWCRVGWTWTAGQCEAESTHSTTGNSGTSTLAHGFWLTLRTPRVSWAHSLCSEPTQAGGAPKEEAVCNACRLSWAHAGPLLKIPWQHHTWQRMHDGCNLHRVMVHGIQQGEA
eukprot:1146609-Pelagomonas_calceolata.AAC.6